MFRRVLPLALAFWLLWLLGYRTTQASGQYIPPQPGQQVWTATSYDVTTIYKRPASLQKLINSAASTSGYQPDGSVLAKNLGLRGSALYRSGGRVYLRMIRLEAISALPTLLFPYYYDSAYHCMRRMDNHGVVPGFICRARG